MYIVLTINLVRFELCDKVPVHLHQWLLGLFILIQHQLGGDGTGHLGRLLHHDHLKKDQRGSEQGVIRKDVRFIFEINQFVSESIGFDIFYQVI